MVFVSPPGSSGAARAKVASNTITLSNHTTTHSLYQSCAPAATGALGRTTHPLPIPGCRPTRPDTAEVSYINLRCE